MKKLLFLLFLIVFVGGCGFNPQTGPKVDVSNNGETVTVKGKEGESVTFGAKEIPSDFPKDVPIYPGSKPTGSYVAAGKDNGLVVGLETTDEFNKVTAYYSEELTKNGWLINGQTQGSAPTGVFAIKKGEVSGVVTIQKQEEKKIVEIAIVLGKVTPAEGTNQ